MEEESKELEKTQKCREERESGEEGDSGQAGACTPSPHERTELASGVPGAGREAWGPGSGPPTQPGTTWSRGNAFHEHGTSGPHMPRPRMQFHLGALAAVAAPRTFLH